MCTFSIITINKNNAIGLKETITSVLDQDFLDYEYIIIDGASKDESIAVMTKCICSKTHVTWISEPDNGIYNAMNKGAAMSKGKYLLFLNSGDKFSSCNVLKEIETFIDGEDIIIGRVNVVKDGKVISTSRILQKKDLSLYYMYLYGIPHQAAFIKRKALIECPYDESLKINSDWKFFVQKIILDGMRVKLLPNIISDYDSDGFSSTNFDLLLTEREKIFKDIIPERIADDYLAIFPHYYEVYRLSWLLHHPICYKLYRWMTSVGMKINH